MNDPTPIAKDPRTLGEMLAAQAVADTIAGRFADAAKDHRVLVTKKFAEANTEHRILSTTVTLPGTDTEVAKAVLNKTHDAATVTDEDAFATWVQENIGPDEVEYKPAVRASTKKAILEKGVEFVPDLDNPTKLVAISKKTGEPIPGVTTKRGGEVKSFTVSGRDVPAIMQWVRDNGIDNAMPQITPDAEPAVVASEVVAEDEAGAA